VSRWLDPEAPSDDLLVVPAIDILEGRVVRLSRGRYDRAKTYERDPAEAARRFAEAGAPTLHVVDLDGARRGEPVNLAAVERIAAAAPVSKLQLGGGIRSADDARAARDAGASAVIVGSRAAVDEAWVARLVDDLGSGGVIGSLDLRAGEVAVEGWTRVAEGSPDVDAVARSWVSAGLRRTIVTDTERDGTMAGARVDVAARFAGGPFAIAAAGGIGGADDLDRLAAAGLDAAIVGRALYEDRVSSVVMADRGWRWSGAEGGD